MAETKLKKQAANQVTGYIPLVLIPPDGFTSGTGKTYWGFNYNANIVMDNLSTGNMARILEYKIDPTFLLTGNFLFKIRCYINSNVTVTPNVLIGYDRSGTISAISGYNNQDQSTFSPGVGVTEDIVRTIATVPASNWQLNDGLIFGLALKSTTLIYLRSAWVEYEKNPLA